MLDHQESRTRLGSVPKSTMMKMNLESCSRSFKINMMSLKFILEYLCCMPCQLGRTHHNTKPDWVGYTSLVMEIAPSLGSPDPEYLQG